MEGIIKYLVSDNPEATKLRNTYVFKATNKKSVIE